MQLVWFAVDVRYLALTTQGAYTGAPAAADAPYLLGYPPLLLAVLLLLRRARAARPRGAFADAAVLGTGVALLGWAVLVGPVLHSTPDDPRARLGAVLFLTCDVVLTGLVVVLLASSSRASTSTWLALAAALAGLVGDSTYLVEGVVPDGVLTALSVGWTSGGALWAAAACHPSAGRAPERSDGEDFGRPRIVALVGGVALAPAVLVLDLVVGGGSSSTPAVVAASAMTLLVVGRLAVALSAAGVSLAEREAMRRALEHQASHDGLTGLPNRSATVARIAEALDAVQRHGARAGLLFVDLDGFKAVNDSHGHRAGDEVLRVVAARLTGCLRPGDVVGRLGGDEFVVVLDDLARAEGETPAGAAVDVLLTTGRRIVEAVAQPVVVDGERVTIGASVGAALAGGTHLPTTADALLHEADTAAYRAKAAGRGRVELAHPAGGTPLRRPAPR